MVLSPTIQSTLLRYQQNIDRALRAALTKVANRTNISHPEIFYGQMQYQMGWVDSTLTPAKSNPGKLLRPTLVLLAYEAAGAWGLASDNLDDLSHLQRALPAASAVEFTHNFTLIHDDIEDGDTERRHRPTVWKVWGVPQAINTGDGLFSLARLALWDVLEQGVESNLAVRLASILDQASLLISEGQYLDISFETQPTISVAAYLNMISCKTAALMACATEMGALLGTRDQETIDRLRSFGETVGIAFQVRDDLLGVWASSAELGKTPAGDIYRRKKSLPILHAMEHASEQDKALLKSIYQQEGPITTQQVEAVLSIMEQTQTKAYCRSFLVEQCQRAYNALGNVPRTASPLALHALEAMGTVVQFLQETAHITR
jgi:geranylgeranyl diphosphate synthase type I